MGWTDYDHAKVTRLTEKENQLLVAFQEIAKCCCSEEEECDRDDDTDKYCHGRILDTVYLFANRKMKAIFSSGQGRTAPMLPYESG